MNKMMTINALLH